MKIKLDKFDIKILNIVQSNNRISTEMIAEEVCLSPSAVQRRLKRLRETGVIEADVSIVNPEAIGPNLILIVEVTLENEQASFLNEFRKLMNETPQVMQCYYVTGRADFILIMTVESMQEFNVFANRFFLESPYIKRYQTSIVVERIKASSIVRLNSE